MSWDKIHLLEGLVKMSPFPRLMIKKVLPSWWSIKVNSNSLKLNEVNYIFKLFHLLFRNKK